MQLASGASGSSHAASPWLSGYSATSCRKSFRANAFQGLFVQQTAESTEQRRDEINLLDVAIVLAKHKRLLFGLPAAAALIAVVVALLLPKIYIASARILPPQQKESSA